MTFRWLNRRMAQPGPYLTLVTNEADFRKAMRHCKAASADSWLKTDHADATAHQLNHPDGQRCTIVAIRVKPKHTAIEIAALLVHEAVHVVQDYFAHMGEHQPATEQQAYAIQAVAQELMTEYARQLEEIK